MRLSCTIDVKFKWVWQYACWRADFAASFLPTVLPSFILFISFPSLPSFLSLNILCGQNSPYRLCLFEQIRGIYGIWAVDECECQNSPVCAFSRVGPLIPCNIQTQHLWRSDERKSRSYGWEPWSNTRELCSWGGRSQQDQYWSRYFPLVDKWRGTHAGSKREIGSSPTVILTSFLYCARTGIERHSNSSKL